MNVPLEEEGKFMKRNNGQRLNLISVLILYDATMKYKDTKIHKYSS